MLQVVTVAANTQSRMAILREGRPSALALLLEMGLSYLASTATEAAVVGVAVGAAYVVAAVVDVVVVGVDAVAATVAIAAVAAIAFVAATAAVAAAAGATACRRFSRRWRMVTRAPPSEGGQAPPEVVGVPSLLLSRRWLLKMPSSLAGSSCEAHPCYGRTGILDPHNGQCR